MENEEIIQKRIGERIREARILLQMSQTELAEKLNKSQDSISAVEKGKRALRASEIPYFASVLQVSVSFFFDEDKERSNLLSLGYQFTPRLFNAVLQIVQRCLQLQSKFLGGVSKIELEDKHMIRVFNDEQATAMFNELDKQIYKLLQEFDFDIRDPRQAIEMAEKHRQLYDSEM